MAVSSAGRTSDTGHLHFIRDCALGCGGSSESYRSHQYSWHPDCTGRIDNFNARLQLLNWLPITEGKVIDNGVHVVDVKVHEEDQVEDEMMSKGVYCGVGLDVFAVNQAVMCLRLSARANDGDFIPRTRNPRQ